MTLPLFDDQAARAPRQVTLVRLSGEIARSLGAIGRIAVEGEVYRPTTSRGGWVFFTLRDRAAQIEVKVPAVRARGSRIVAGERVCVVGGLQWGNERGQVHLAAEEVSPVGAGAIAELIETTRRRLAAEGLLDRFRRPIPALPRVVAVVCGTDAAVRKDIESVVAERCLGYPVHFEETTVSGPGAPLSIVDAIGVAASVPGVEVLILARGGGDAPSLLPWSTEEVCRAIAACPVPVVSAIGHDGDHPLCDDVADLRAATPSLAATTVLPDLAALGSALDVRLDKARALVAARLEFSTQLLERIDATRALGDGLTRAGNHLEHARLRLAGQHPERRVAGCEARLGATLEWRHLVWETLGRAEGRLAAERRHLVALSPQRTLERGYAVVTGPTGDVIRRAGDLRQGDLVRVRVAHGAVTAAVTRVEPVDHADD
jgi:exodeoxyribonuclease VII large subunit